MAAALVSISMAAQDTVITSKKQAELIIPRPALQPVQSMEKVAADAVDTLDTANPHIRILLMADYTWKYIKDPSYVAAKEVFPAGSCPADI